MNNPTRPNSRPKTGPPPLPRKAYPRKARKPNAATKLGKFGAYYVLPIVLLMTIAAVVGYVRLRHGPVSLNVLVPPIERGISSGLGGMGVSIESALLMLGEDGGLEFRLSNLSLLEEDGDLVASAPIAAIELSPESFWSMRVEPSRIYLIEPRLALTYTRNAGLKVSFREPAKSPDDDITPKEDTTSRVISSSGTSGPSPVKQLDLDLARYFAESTSQARQGGAVTSNLREIGFRNALVSLDYEGLRSEWRVAEAAVDLEHRSRKSVITGSARVATDQGSWSLSFRAEDREKKGSILLQTSVRDFAPRTLAHAFPGLAFLDVADVPVAADASFDVSHAGSLNSADIAIELGAGHFNVASFGQASSRVDAGLLSLNYSAKKRQLVLRPSTVRTGESFVTLAGLAADTAPDGLGETWNFEVKSSEGMIAAEEFGVAGTPITNLSAAGSYNATDGSLKLANFNFKAGEAEISLEGELGAGPRGQSTRLDGQFSPMPVAMLKTLWPRAIAPTARELFGNGIAEGRVQSGTFRYLAGTSELGGEAGRMPARMSLAFELADLRSPDAQDAIGFAAPRALVRLEGDSLEVNVPDALIAAGPSQSAAIKSARFTAVSLGGSAPVGEAVFRVQSPLAALIAALSRKPARVLQVSDLPIDTLDGRVDGLFTIKLPLGKNKESTPVTVEGQAKVTEIKSKKPIGSLDLQGGSINLTVSSEAIDARGELLLNGALAKVFWRRPLDAISDQEPPLQIMATLDNSDRNQVGLDVNHIVQGDMGIEITISKGTNGLPSVHVKVDLTPSELVFDELAFVKPVGQKAVLDFDVTKGEANPLELHNIKLTGDNIAVEGWAAIDSSNDLKEFYFPEFSLNVVSRLEVRGKLGSDRVWKVKASGSTLDARDLFTSLISLGGPKDRGIKPLRPSAGMDLDANVANVIGHNDTALRGMKLRMSQRSQKVTALNVESTIDGGKPFAAQLRPSNNGQRIVYVDSTDAGQAFKLVNFYPNVQGGRVRLEVNLDGKGAAERTGILWVEKFRVLGDPVLTEVISSADNKQGPTDKKIVREVYDFDILRAPFSAGHEQFVLEDSQVRGPVVGATIAGKVDFSSRSLNLGGTYIPLQGINSALCAIPLVGLIITGPKCDGVVGITYAIQGPMARPQVIVNPLSMFTPGILKEIMQMTNPNQRVQARENKSPKSPVSERVGTSASEAIRAGSQASQSGQGKSSSGGIDGWSSQVPGQN